MVLCSGVAALSSLRTVENRLRLRHAPGQTAEPESPGPPRGSGRETGGGKEGAVKILKRARGRWSDQTGGRRGH